MLAAAKAAGTMEVARVRVAAVGEAVVREVGGR